MPRPVVEAAIVDSLENPTVLLACSRAYPEELRGLFELPGGKIEDGEDAVGALEREISEELGARLTIGERVCPDGGLWWPIVGGRVMVCGSLRLLRARRLRARAPRTWRPGGCPLLTWRTWRGSPPTFLSSRPWLRTVADDASCGGLGRCGGRGQECAEVTRPRADGARTNPGQRA